MFCPLGAVILSHWVGAMVHHMLNAVLYLAGHEILSFPDRLESDDIWVRVATVLGSNHNCHMVERAQARGEAMGNPIHCESDHC